MKSIFLHLCLIGATNFMLTYSCFATSDPLYYYKEKENIKYLCDHDEVYKFSRTEKIGLISLSITDMEFESGDADSLNVSYSGYRISTKIFNEKLYSDFIASIAKHNEKLEIDLSIDKSRDEKFRQCLRSSGQSKFSDMQRCSAEADAFVGAKYGNAIGQFYCRIKIKRREFPILSYSECVVRSDNELRYRQSFLELTDLNYFEPSTVQEGITRMLDQHVKSLSEVFVLAKQCNP